MPSNHLILCHPLLLLPSIFPTIRVFSSESVLGMRCPMYWSFSFSINPSNEYSGLISFRIDWSDLLEVQRTFKNLLQHHSLKSSVLCHSAFLMAPLSMDFSRQECWSGLHFLLQGIFPTQESKLGLPHCRQILSGLKHKGNLTNDIYIYIYIYICLHLTSFCMTVSIYIHIMASGIILFIFTPNIPLYICTTSYLSTISLSISLLMDI